MTSSVRSQAGKPSCRIIAVVNQKGGVGKTTTAINLAACLAMEHFPTLLIDCDPQANSTSGLGIRQDSERVSIYDLFSGTATAHEASMKTDVMGLSIIPGSRNLVGANLELTTEERREYRLRDALAPIREQYRFLILDCPPALDLLTLNALVAADSLLVPLQAEYFALEGISELVNTLDRVSLAFNPNLGLEGVLLTMYDDRTNLSQQVAANLREFFKDKLLQTTIPRNVRLAEAPSHGQPAVIYDPRSRGAEAYRQLTIELLGRMGVHRKGDSPKSSALSNDAEPLPSVKLWPYKR